MRNPIPTFVQMEMAPTSVESALVIPKDTENSVNVRQMMLTARNHSKNAFRPMQQSLVPDVASVNVANVCVQQGLQTRPNSLVGNIVSVMTILATTTINKSVEVQKEVDATVENVNVMTVIQVLPVNVRPAKTSV
jgi:hypothetical protein